MYRTRQINRTKKPFGSKVNPISTVGPGGAPGTTRRDQPDSPLNGFDMSRKVTFKKRNRAK